MAILDLDSLKPISLTDKDETLRILERQERSLRLKCLNCGKITHHIVLIHTWNYLGKTAMSGQKEILGASLKCHSCGNLIPMKWRED